MTNPPDDRSPMALAYAWAARVMTVSIEMVVPGVVGFWLDQRLGTKVLLTVVGLALGMSVGMWHLLRMTKSMPNESSETKDSVGGTDKQ